MKASKEHKPQQSRLVNNLTLQLRYKTRSESVACDMINHLETCFRIQTIEEYSKLSNWKKRMQYGTVNIGDIVNRIRPNNHICPIHVDYQQKVDKAMPQKEDLIKWLGDGCKEHMWVHHGNKINIASRNDEKLPHPTLFGGDPEVTGAGLMYLSPFKKTVTINNSSGHFRPNDVDGQSQQIVRNSLPKEYKLEVGNH